MSRNILLMLFVMTFLNSFGQSKVEQANRAVFNKIEFFINTQMTDSIYSLASEKFKSEVSPEQLAFVLNNLYQLGKIQNVEVIDFKGQTATYLLEFPQNRVQAALSIDSTYHYDGLLFSRAPQAEIPKDQPRAIDTADKVSTLTPYIDSLGNGYVNKTNTQSLSIGIFHKNQYNAYFYGETEKGNQTAPQESSLYEIGSITKVFTAVLLADLVTRNIIQLDDSIARFLPDSVRANETLAGITFKSLANHTSGLPRLPDNAGSVHGFTESDPYAAYDRKALFSFLKDYKAERAPGEEYVYSNLGFGLLGELIAIITKKPYMQYLRETILTPLQMVHTTDKPDAKKKEVLLKVYDKQGNETPSWNFQSMIGAGGLKSNIKNLMLFAVEQFKMPQNDLQHAMALTRQFTFFTPDNTDIGLGWHMSMLDGTIYFHHTGGTGGSSSFIGLSPDTKTAVIVLSNAAESVNPVGVAIIRKLLSAQQ